MLVGLAGKIGSGKTCLASEFKLARGDGVVEVNFGDALKREVAETYKVPLWRFYDQDEKNKPISSENPMTLGEALQKVGTERREQDPDYWVKKVALHVGELKDFDIVIIGDVRLQNEANWIKEAGGVIVRLNGDPGKVRANSTRNLTHISETDLDDYKRFDFVFDTETMSAEAICKIVLDALEK